MNDLGLIVGTLRAASALFFPLLNYRITLHPCHLTSIFRCFPKYYV